LSDATLELFSAGPAEADAWSAFVAGTPGSEAAHCWEFLDLLEQVFHLRTFRLVARRCGAWVAVLPLVLQQSLVGRFLTSLPYLNYAGVLGEDASARRALGEEAAALMTRWKADRLEIRGRNGSDLPLTAWNGKAGYSLDLPRSSEALWSSLGAKLRAQVKRPGKEGFEARIVSEGGRGLFHPLHARRWHELGSPMLPEAFFAGLERAFPRLLDYVVVEKGNTVAAAGILLHHADVVEMPWASSALEHDRVGVNMLLYWRSIERAIERGARRFDFGRSTPGSGNARFKLQWGAVETLLRWNVLAAGSQGHASERGDRRREILASAWRRLPAFVARRLGPLLAARIPL
jgi:serine/alanine adding enzyme